MQHLDLDFIPQDRSRSGALGGVVAAALGVGITMLAVVALGRASSGVEGHAVLLLTYAVVTTLALWVLLARQRALRWGAIGGVGATLAVAVIAGGALSRPTVVDEDVVRASAPAVAPTDAISAGDSAPATEPEAMQKEPTVMTKEPDARADATAAPTPAPVPAPKPAPAPAPAPSPAPAANTLLASGSFEALEHPGSGRAELIKTSSGTTVLTLTSFSTDAVPDPYVWLVRGNPTSDSDVEAGSHVVLGRLKGSSGDQQYELPDGVDPTEFTHVYIWCRAFSSGITRAALT